MGQETNTVLFGPVSAGKALSIQCHPDKANAERLHREDPAHYPDDNHKPELAVALTPFEAMCVGKSSSSRCLIFFVGSDTQRCYFCFKLLPRAGVVSAGSKRLQCY